MPPRLTGRPFPSPDHNTRHAGPVGVERRRTRAVRGVHLTAQPMPVLNALPRRSCVVRARRRGLAGSRRGLEDRPTPPGADGDAGLPRSDAAPGDRSADADAARLRRLRPGSAGRNNGVMGSSTLIVRTPTRSVGTFPARGLHAGAGVLRRVRKRSRSARPRHLLLVGDRRGERDELFRSREADCSGAAERRTKELDEILIPSSSTGLPAASAGGIRARRQPARARPESLRPSNGSGPCRRPQRQTHP